MTIEERQLLLKDLCARLPYGVMAKPNKGVGFTPARVTAITDYIDVKVTLEGSLILPLDMVQPYLRPMSSMTEEEVFEFIQISDSVLRIGEKKLTCILSLEQMDWLNAHHFDYRGLIPMGLALEAPEDMYKTE